jgi:hypothetical protein
MDRIRKSVEEQQMTLFIVIRKCFDGFLASLVLITNIRKIMLCFIIISYVKPCAVTTGFYDEKYLLLYVSTKIISSHTRR